MLADIKRFLTELAGGRKVQFAENDYRLAAAALLVHIATLDGELSDAEHGRLRAILRAWFALDEATTDELITAAAAADREAVDFYHFTSVLMRALDEAGRLRVIEEMWKMVYVDGRVSEFEENMMWRVADLLGISARERITLRQKAAQARLRDVP